MSTENYAWEFLDSQAFFMVNFLCYNNSSLTKGQTCRDNQLQKLTTLWRINM